jgi:hypothetical protein
MTQQAYLESLAEELHRRCTPYDSRALETFVRGVWPQAQRDPDPDRWAGEFIAWQRGHAEEG